MRGDGSEGDRGKGMRLAVGRVAQELALRLNQAAFAHALHWAQHDAPLPEWLTPHTLAQHAENMATQNLFPQSTAGLEYPADYADAVAAAHGTRDAAYRAAIMGEAAAVPLVALYSAHDSTLIPLLDALGLHDGVHWPPYASTLQFELYSTHPLPTFPPTSTRTGRSARSVERMLSPTRVRRFPDRSSSWR